MRGGPSSSFGAPRWAGRSFSLSARFRDECNDRNRYAIAAAHALRLRMACRAILRLDAGSGLSCGLLHEGCWHERPRGRVGVFGLPPEDSVSCHTCLDGPCDSEYHQSALRLRAWLLDQVTVAPIPLPAKPRVFTSLGGVVDLKLATAEARRRASRLGARGERRPRR